MFRGRGTLFVEIKFEAESEERDELSAHDDIHQAVSGAVDAIAFPSGVTTRVYYDRPDIELAAEEAEEDD